MSKYTTEVRFICEMNSGFDVETMSKHSVDEIILASHNNVFNFNYPIFDENYRERLEVMILKHYYFREICCETVELWRTFLNATLNEIMPKYNKLYELEKENAEKLFNNIDVHFDGIRIDDLLELTDYLRTDKLKSQNEGEQHTHYVDNNVTRNAYSDTPQGSLTFNETDSGNVWLTDFRRINGNDVSDTDVNYRSETNDTGTQRNEGEKKNTGDVKNINHEYGYRGGKTYYEMLNDLNDKFINIDLLIINDLKQLFFLLW